MKFANKEAEELFLEFHEKYGLMHINSSVPITVEAIQSLKNSLLRTIEESEME